MNSRMDRSKLIIGTYILQPYARTRQHIQALADCGIHMIIGMEEDLPTLDLFSEYNLGAIVTGIVPGWWGGYGDHIGTMSKQNPLPLYKEAATRFKDHPAIWGIDIGDEPGAPDFPHYGKVVSLVEHEFPNQFAYVNLYANYGVVSENTPKQTLSQLGVPSYSDYIKTYCQYVNTDYICFDHYLYSSSAEQALDNLQVVSDACRQYQRSLWMVLQVNSKTPDRFITENQLRYQAYSALAYGAQVLLWACYTAGWWHHQVVDDTGMPTEQYEKLRHVNHELNTLGPFYMQYKNVETRCCNEQQPLINYGPVDMLSVSKNGALLVGRMQSKTTTATENQALFLCACDDPYDNHPSEYTIHFRTAKPTVMLYTSETSKTLFPNAQNEYCFQLSSCHGALLTFSESKK